ncbi:hypothetical protein Q9233_014898 [Columba guinea]|nr:hypothetical protein Q9233_014898 [Columba guinea]
MKGQTLVKWSNNLDTEKVLMSVLMKPNSYSVAFTDRLDSCLTGSAYMHHESCLCHDVRSYLHFSASFHVVWMEDSADCGGVSGLSPSLWSVVGIQLVLLWLLSGSRHCQL